MLNDYEKQCITDIKKELKAGFDTVIEKLRRQPQPKKLFGTFVASVVIVSVLPLFILLLIELISKCIYTRIKNLINSKG